VDIGEGQEIVQAFAQEQGLTFLIPLDTTGAVAQGYSVQGVPTSLFIDREGVIQARYTGPMTEALIAKHLDQIL
jgi:hypothetical protein